MFELPPAPLLLPILFVPLPVDKVVREEWPASLHRGLQVCGSVGDIPAGFQRVPQLLKRDPLRCGGGVVAALYRLHVALAELACSLLRTGRFSWWIQAPCRFS